MTISTEVRKAGPFIGNDSASVFPFAFKVFKAADLIVVRRQDNIGEETTLILDSDYHVTLNSNQDTTPGGVVTLVAGALASGFTLVVSSELPYLQPTDLTNQGGFYPKVITNALDRLTIFCQQLAEITGRTLKLPITAPTNISAEIPLPNPSELIAWNETGTGLTTVSPQSLVTSIAYGSATADLFAGDGVTTTFPLTTNPASVNNLDVSIGGYSQRPVQDGVGDYSWNGGASITFAVPPPVPTVPGDKNVLVRYMQAIPVSDSEALHAQTREALRRSYAEAGYNLVDGSFETGGTLALASDVLLLESTGAAYAWTGALPKNVAPGFDPVGVVGFELRASVQLRSELSSNSGAILIGGLPFVSPLHFSATPGASVDATSAIKSAISKSISTGWPLDLRGGPWLFSQTIDFTGVRCIVSDYSGRLICNPVGFTAATADVGAWAVTFGLPIGGAFANRNDAVIISGTLWVESLNRDAALDGVYLKGAWINAGHIRAVKFKGWGIYRDSVWDSTFDRCSVELCGTTAKHAYWHSSNGDTANASHTNSVQCEQAYHKAIYINAIRDVIDNIHAERTFQLTANDGSANADGSTWLNSFVLLGNSTLNQLVMDSATVNPTTGETIVAGQLYKAQFGLDGSTVISAKVHGDVLQVFGGGEYISLACEKYYQKSPSSGVVINSPLITTAQVESGVTLNGGSVTNARFNFNARNIRYNSVTVSDVATTVNLQGDIKFSLCKISTVGDTRYSAAGYSPIEFYGCEIATFTGAYDASAWVYGGYINSCPLASQSRARFFDVEFGTFAPTGNSGYLTRGCWAATVSSWAYPLNVSYPAGTVTERVGYNASGKIYQNTDGALTWSKIA